MSLRPESLPPIPDTTAAAVRAAFPKGNLSVDLRTEFGTLYHDQLFADLYPPEGRPVEVAPWRLALVMVMQYIEGLTDRQAADAVRRCMDWKYALSLDLHDPGFDFTLLHDFRERLLAHEAAQRLLDTFLAACKTHGWIKPRGTQRTDSTHVLAAVRRLYSLECVQEALRHALNQLSEVNAPWVHQHVPVAWYERYGPRAEVGRFPQEARKRAALALQSGVDGYPLLEWLGADAPADDRRRRPAVEVLRPMGGAALFPLYGPRPGNPPVAQHRRAAPGGPPDAIALRRGRARQPETRDAVGGPLRCTSARPAMWGSPR